MLDAETERQVRQHLGRYLPARLVPDFAEEIADVLPNWPSMQETAAKPTSAPLSADDAALISAFISDQGAFTELFNIIDPPSIADAQAREYDLVVATRAEEAALVRYLHQSYEVGRRVQLRAS